MFPPLAQSVLAGVAIFGIASAQLTTKCDPLNSTCSPDSALCGDFNYDFRQASWDKGFDKDFLVDPGVEYHHEKITFDPVNGAGFTMRSEDDAPTIWTNKYMFFGNVEFEVQAAPGTGIITAITFQSDDLDEIDFEFVGMNQNEVQTNFYAQGRPKYGVYNRTLTVPNAMASFHTYGVEWMPQYIAFSIDGKEMTRTLYNDADSGTDFPQSPMRVKAGTWVAGSTNQPEGTIEWGGGMADFSTGPKIAYFRNLKMTDYCGGYTDGQEYVYGDHSGSWQSIQVVGGKAGPGLGNSTTSESGSAPSGSSATTSGSVTTSTTTPVAKPNAGANSTTSTAPASTKPNSGVKVILVPVISFLVILVCSILF